jgi:DNA-binding NtrC family response regulator
VKTAFIPRPAPVASSIQVLLVEDDPALRSMLRGVLELHGFAVAEADCRGAALDMLRGCAGIDVVLLDFGLPPCPHQITEGIETLKAIQTEIMRVKVIVLSGQDQDEVALEAIREGAFDFLAKPAAAERILHAVGRAALFLQKEQQLGQQGVTRIAINAQFGEGLKGVRDNAEGRLVRQVLKETGFNVYKSAKRLGVKRENVYYLMKKFGIERHD